MNGGVGEEEIRNMEDGVEDDKEVRDREHQQKQRHHGFINSGGLKTGTVLAPLILISLKFVYLA